MGEFAALLLLLTMMMVVFIMRPFALLAGAHQLRRRARSDQRR